MRQYIIINELQKFDNDPDIYKFRFQYNNYPMWMMLRSEFVFEFWNVLEDAKQESSAGTSSVGIAAENHEIVDKKKKKGSKIKHLAKKVLNRLKSERIYLYCYLHNRRIAKGKTILFYKTNRHYIENGVMHENVFDGFIRALPKESVLLKSYGTHDKKIKYAGDVIYREGLVSPKYLKKNKLFENNEDKKNFIEFLQYIIDRDEIGVREERKKNWLNSASHREKEWRDEAYFIDRICRLLPNLKLAVISEAAYTHENNSCHAFHSHHIPVLEIQHGSIYKHEVYLPGDVLRDSPDYCDMMPDYLGVWSDYWAGNCNLNTKMVVLGNPDALNGMDRIKTDDTASDRILLLCSFGSRDENFRYLDEFLDIGRKDIHLRIRIHPSQKPDLAEYAKYLKHSNISMDDNHDFYDALRDAEAMVSEASTTGYEALACGVRSFRVWRDGIPGGPDEAIVVHSMYEIIEKMDSLLGQKIDGETYRKKYFGGNPINNYLDFVKQL